MAAATLQPQDSTVAFRQWLQTHFQSDESDAAASGAAASRGPGAAPSARCLLQEAANWRAVGAPSAAPPAAASQPSSPAVVLVASTSVAVAMEQQVAPPAAPAARASKRERQQKRGSGSIGGAGQRAPARETAQQRAHRLFYERKKELVRARQALGLCWGLRQGALNP
jgi:hypothetical protein